MNAISLLSGWSGSSEDQQQQTAISSNSAAAPRGSRRTRRSRTNVRRQLSDISDEDDDPARISAAGSRNTEWQPEGLLKSPGAKAYEELGSTNISTIAHPDSQLNHTYDNVEDTSGYASSSAIPPSELPLVSASEASPIDIEIEASGEDVLSQDTAMVAASSAAPAPPATSSQASLGDNAEDAAHLHRQRLAKSRFLARSWPARCAVRFYVLLRRFLALFGLRLPYVQTPSIDSISSQSHMLAHAVPDHPPSYTEATSATSERTAQTQEPAKGQLKSRWRFPGLPGSKRRLSKSTVDDVPPYAAPKTDTRDAEKSDSEVTDPVIMPRPLGKGHAKTHSRTSAAQIAVDKPKMLVLDLDETLIHSTSRMGYNGGYGPVTQAVDNRLAYKVDTSGLKVRVVEVVLDGRSVVYHVYKRPWVDFFLRKVSSWYTVVIFTASMQEYADPVIDWLDQGKGIINGRLFRESCTFTNGSYVKDLSIVDADLARVCLIDNSPASYAKNRANGIPIEGWINDPNDEALLDLLPMLDSLRFTTDVRHILGLRLASTSTILPAKLRRPRSSTAASSASTVTSDEEVPISSQ